MLTVRWNFGAKGGTIVQREGMLATRRPLSLLVCELLATIDLDANTLGLPLADMQPQPSSDV